MDISKIDMLGVLARNGDPILGGKDSVFINSQQSLQYLVKRISHAPQKDSSEFPMVFTGYLDSLSGGYETHDNMAQNDFLRTAAFRDEFDRYAFIFRGREDLYYSTCKMQRDAAIQQRTKAIKEGEYATQYVTLPIFQPHEKTTEWEREKRIDLKRVYSSFSEFIEQLKKKNPVGLVDGFQEPMSTPFVIWNDTETGTYCAIGYFEKCVVTSAGYQFIYDYLGKIVLTSEIMSGIIYPDEFNPTIIYMEEECYTQLYNRFAQHLVDDTIIDSTHEEDIKEANNTVPA